MNKYFCTGLDVVLLKVQEITFTMLNRQKIILLAIVILTPFVSISQRWNTKKHEANFSIGATNFLGDLGGATKGEGHRYKDFQLSVTRPALSFNYKYRFAKHFKFRLGMAFGYVAADDEKAGNISRQRRNLNFRSPIVEIAPMIEWYFLQENKSSSYRVKGMKGQLFENMGGYLFGGVGLFYYNPQGQDDNGNWINLSKLNTEGQGLPGGPADYNTVSLAIPIGFGFTYAIDKEWSIGFEYGLRVTTTDYIDDVSSAKYYEDPDLLSASYGIKAVEMADRRTIRRGLPGRRGNPDNNDSYMFAFFSVTKKFKVKPGNRTRF